MITNIEKIYEIRNNGKAITWTENRTDRDGWIYETTVKGYEYNGNKYTLDYDRDGWTVMYEYGKKFGKEEG